MTKKGFTLIELLVVIAIIGILVAMASFGMQGAFSSSRNARRKSDIKQYQASLADFANKNKGTYPLYPVSTQISTTICTDLGLTNCPEDPDYDPATGEPRYNYKSNSLTTIATEYFIWAKLETTSGNSYWVICSNGKAGETATNPNISNECPLN